MTHSWTVMPRQGLNSRRKLWNDLMALKLHDLSCDGLFRMLYCQYSIELLTMLNLNET